MSFIQKQQEKPQPARYKRIIIKEMKTDRRDILFRKKRGIFSYRVAGVIIRGGKVLLQRPPDDPGYAFPGGHVAFGEVSTDTLVREFKEEIAADVTPVRLLWVGENFFPWDDKDCHQICLYFLMKLADETQIPLEGSFWARDTLGAERFDLEFRWVDLADLGSIELYPPNTKDKLARLPEQVEHFIYIEKPA
jgi:ADP-ribose pyrophosphatase YjhB (NUDIX family)